jgi:hypothetical protein
MTTTPFLKELTTDLNSTVFTARDFTELRGFQVDDYFEVQILKRILTWEMEVLEDEDGSFLYFELLGEFKYGSGTIEETFVLRIEDTGDAIIEIKNQSKDYKVSAEDVAPILKKLKLI